MRMLIVTPRPSDFSDFLAALTESGVETSLASTEQAALGQVKIEPPTLVVVDEALAEGDAFAFVARLMQVNAAIHTAVVSGLTPDAFHEAGEGLGILTALPRHPGAQDARRLVKTLLPVT